MTCAYSDLCITHALCFLLFTGVNCFNNSDETTVDSFINKETWGKEEYPNPRTHRGSILCGNGNEETRRWVCDPGKSLTEGELEALDNTIVGWQMDAQCPCENCLSTHGPYYQIMVAIIPKLKVDSNEMQDKSPVLFDFAEYLRTGPWDYSQCDDNLVLALSTGDQAIWPAAGKTIRDILSEGCMEDIFNENLELLQSGVHGIALQNIVTEYISVLMGKRSCGKRWPKWWKYLAIAVLSFGMLLFFADRFSRFVFQRPLFYCFGKNENVEPSVHRFQSQVEPAEFGYDTSSESSSLSRIGSNHANDYIINDFHNSDYSLHHSSTERSSHEMLRNVVQPVMMSHKSDSSNSVLSSNILVFNPSNNYSDSNFADHSSDNTLDMLDSNSSVRSKSRASKNLHKDIT